jgi:hypothetical protein
MTKLKNRLHVRDGFDGIDFYFGAEDNSGRLFLARPAIVDEYDRGSRLGEPTFRMTVTECKQLMDDLYAMGFRPTDAADNAGELKATKAHLKDMRDIVANAYEVMLDGSPLTIEQLSTVPADRVRQGGAK